MSRALTEHGLQSFFVSPTGDEFAQLRNDALQTAGYDFLAASLVALERRLNHEKPSILLKELGDISPSFHICPRYHYVDARIREALGEVTEMELSIDRLRACITAIVETGEGSRVDPFLGLFLTDQDDVLRAIGERSRSSAFVQEKAHAYDVVTAHSGSEYWFDVTDVVDLRLGNRVSAMVSDV